MTMITTEKIILLMDSQYSSELFGNVELEQLDDEFFLSDTESGVAFTFDLSQHLASAHIYGCSIDGFTPYKGELPYGLFFGMEESECRKLLPQPQHGGGGVLSAVDGKLIPRWCRYDGPNFSVHLQFGKGLELITIMRSSSVPR